jgi:hypothetical protein
MPEGGGLTIVTEELHLLAAELRRPDEAVAGRLRGDPR